MFFINVNYLVYKQKKQEGTHIKENKPYDRLIPARSMYDKYARYYDMMTDRHVEDLPLYEQLISEKSPPYLEVGCGTGRILSHLLSSKGTPSKGLYLAGVDISDEMLGICREKNAQYITTGILEVKNHDFTLHKLPRGEQFNAAFVTFFTLNYIPEQLQEFFLSHIRDSLNPDGIVTIDCFYPYLKWHPEKAGEIIESDHIDKDGKHIKMQTKSKMTTPTVEQREWTFIEPDGTVKTISSSRTYISPARGKQLLETAGFKDIKRVSNYQLPGVDEFTEASQGYNFVLLAKK
jgi:SAM-dependent methyltransferase